MALDHVVTIRVPFESERQAQIARRTIAVDPILKKDEIDVAFTTESAVMVAKFAGASDRVIRVAISNCIDNIKTVIETMDEFDGKENVVFTEAELGV